MTTFEDISLERMNAADTAYIALEPIRQERVGLMQEAMLMQNKADLDAAFVLAVEAELKA